MIFHKWFYVDNYVGTYEIGYSPVLNKEIIVSKENVDSSSENRLKRKRIFENDAKNSEQIYTKFSNISIESEDSILAYCNKYGLPYSSQIIEEKMLWADPDDTFDNNTDADGVNVSELSIEQLKKKDIMTLKGFCNSVILVRNLLRLQSLTDAKELDSSQYMDLLSLLVFFLFFSHENDFCYDPHEDNIPKSQLLRFQYAFQLFVRKNPLARDATTAEQVGLFLYHCQFTKERGAEAVESRHFWSLVNSKSVENVLNLFSFLIGTLDGDGKENLFSYCSYGNVKFEEDVLGELNQERQEEICCVGKEVLCDVINDGLSAITPVLKFDGKSLHGDWELNFQMAGIFMEIYMETTNQFLIRQCADPTCGNFFSVSRNRPNKMYCCEACAHRVAKRKERERKKLQAEQLKVKKQPIKVQK